MNDVESYQTSAHSQSCAVNVGCRLASDLLAPSRRGAVIINKGTAHAGYVIRRLEIVGSIAGRGSIDPDHSLDAPLASGGRQLLDGACIVTDYQIR